MSLAYLKEIIMIPFKKKKKIASKASEKRTVSFKHLDVQFTNIQSSLS